MNIIITAGGTTESIDGVRSITNTSTGSLGVEIANVFEKNSNLHIDYIVGKHAKKPAPSSHLRLHVVTDVASVEQKVVELLKKKNIDYFIHAMAISDFKVHTVESLSDAKTRLYQAISEGNSPDDIVARFFQTNASTLTKKLSSKDDIYIHMTKTPKIIHMIKTLSPSTSLIGFKLLENVSEDELIEVANALGKKNQCNYVIANDIKNIHANSHEAILLKEDEIVKRLHTKKEIAEALYTIITSEYEYVSHK